MFFVTSVNMKILKDKNQYYYVIHFGNLEKLKTELQIYFLIKQRYKQDINNLFFYSNFDFDDFLLFELNK